MKGKCQQAKNQENKKKIWLKAQIAKNQSKDAQWKSRKNRLLRLSKNHKNQIFLFLYFLSTKEKNRLRVRGPNLLTVQP
jgi:hypothetical protein